MKSPSAVVWGVSLSLVFHVGAAVGIRRMPARSITKTTVVSVVETKKKPKPKPEEPKKEAPKPDEPKEPKAPPIVKAAPKPVAPPPAPVDVPPPPPVANPTPNAFAGNPGLAGLQNVGTMTGGGGLAIPTGGPEGVGANAAPTTSATTKNKEKVLGAAPTAKVATAAGSLDDGCTEEVTKPKPQSMPQPAYSDEARSSEIEGVVTVRVRVDASGHVIEATVTKPLGHGLDERAITAAKGWTFSPGTRCGKPSESKFVMNMRFALGE